jgi:hypothetical protein
MRHFVAIFLDKTNFIPYDAHTLREVDVSTVNNLFVWKGWQLEKTLKNNNKKMKTISLGFCQASK